MPEPPDFDQIARRLTTALGFSGYGSPPDTIREALKDVWNARGAADLAALEAELSEMIATKTTHERLDRALRTLDR